MISYFTQKGVAEDMYTTMLVILFFAAVIAFSFWNTIKKQKAVYNSYLLTVGDNYIQKEQDTLNTNRISFNEIQRIEEDVYGNLFVWGPVNQNVVAVSANIDGYLEVKGLLHSFKPISVRKESALLHKYSWFVLFIPCGLMIAVYLSNNKIVVAATGVPLIAILLWGFYKVRTNPYFTSKSKRSTWLIPIVLISLIVIIYYKLFGF